MENEDKSMELNAAYGASTFHLREDNVYDIPQIVDIKRNVLTDENKITKKQKIILVIGGCALGLAILALLVAAVAIYLGVRAGYLQNISTLYEMVQALQTELYKQGATATALTNILTKSKGTFWNPVRYCSNIPQESSSGDYWIQTNGTSNPVQVYCDMNRTSCSCNTTGGWMRVANLDMTDPSQNCPVGFQQLNRPSAPLRTCGRPGPAGCVSTTFQTYGVEYSHVCGRVIGYQDQTPDAFSARNINSIYVDGISLTHGLSPRKHIWSFAGAVDERGLARPAICPCTRSDIPYIGPEIPSFVGQDYFCDTGSRGHFQYGVLYANDPLWDVRVTALAVSSTIYHGSVSNSLSQPQMILN